jgi:hypothetical protein
VTALRCIVRGYISSLELPLECMGLRSIAIAEPLYHWNSLCMCAALMLVEFYRAERTAFKRLNVNTTDYACGGARGNHTYPGRVYLLNRSTTNPKLGHMVTYTVRSDKPLLGPAQ